MLFDKYLLQFIFSNFKILILYFNPNNVTYLQRKTRQVIYIFYD